MSNHLPGNFLIHRPIWRFSHSRSSRQVSPPRWLTRSRLAIWRLCNPTRPLLHTPFGARFHNPPSLDLGHCSCANVRPKRAQTSHTNSHRQKGRPVPTPLRFQPRNVTLHRNQRQQESPGPINNNPAGACNGRTHSGHWQILSIPNLQVWPPLLRLLHKDGGICVRISRPNEVLSLSVSFLLHH